MDELKKQAEELGIKVDKRWSEETLQEEVNKAVAAKASADAEIQAEIEERARVRAAEEEAEQDALQSAVIVNLQANPMKSLGLTSYGEATITELQMADPRFAKKVERAIQLGLVKVK